MRPWRCTLSNLALQANKVLYVSLCVYFFSVMCKPPLLRLCFALAHNAKGMALTPEVCRVQTHCASLSSAAMLRYLHRYLLFT